MEHPRILPRTDTPSPFPVPRPPPLPRALLLLLALSLPGCGLLKKVVKPPKAREARLKFVKASFDEADVEFSFTLENPNGMGVTLYRMDYALEVAGRKVAFGETPEGSRIALPARGKAQVKLPVTIPYADLREALAAAFQEEEVPFRFDGGVRILEPAFGGLRIPLHKEGMIPSLRPPRLELSDLRLDAFSWSEIRLTLSLKVENRAKRPLALRRFGGSLLLNGTSVARIPALKIEKELPGEGMVPVEIPVEISPKALGLEVRSIFKERRVRYAFEGEAEFELLDAGPVTKRLDLKGETELKRREEKGPAR